MRRVDEIFVPKHIENTETREMVKNSLSKNKRKTNNIEEWREKNAHSQEKKTLSLRFRSPPPPTRLLGRYLSAEMRGRFSAMANVRYIIIAAF